MFRKLTILFSFLVGVAQADPPIPLPGSHRPPASRQPIQSFDHDKNPSHRNRERAKGAIKPKVLWMNVAPDDKMVNDSESHVKGKLEACGYQVTAEKISSANDAKAFLENKSNADGAIVVVNGHGKNQGTGGHSVGNDHACLIPSQDLLSAVQKSAPGAPIYMDTCHAGTCNKFGISNLAVSCLGNEESAIKRDAQGNATQSEVTEFLTDVLCDANRSCRYFTKNGQKKQELDGAQLTQLFKELYGFNPDEYAVRVVETAEELAKHETDCKKNGLDFSSVAHSDVIPVAKVTVRDTDGKVILQETKKFFLGDKISSLSETFEAEEFVRSALWEKKNLWSENVKLVSQIDSENSEYAFDGPRTKGLKAYVHHEKRKTEYFRYRCQSLTGPAATSPDSRDLKSRHPTFPKDFKVKCQPGS